MLPVRIVTRKDAMGEHDKALLLKMPSDWYQATQDAAAKADVSMNAFIGNAIRLQLPHKVQQTLSVPYATSRGNQHTPPREKKERQRP